MNPREHALREALDDLWANIGVKEMQHLDPATLSIAASNHTYLWHSE